MELARVLAMLASISASLRMASTGVSTCRWPGPSKSFGILWLQQLQLIRRLLDPELPNKHETEDRARTHTHTDTES